MIKAVLMLRGIKTKYETFHGIHITDQALESAVKLSRRYIAGRQLPDKAIDLLDTSATRVKMSLSEEPACGSLRHMVPAHRPLNSRWANNCFCMGVPWANNKLALPTVNIWAPMLTDAQAKKALADLGMQAAGGSAADLEGWIKQEDVRWGGILKAVVVPQ